MATETGIDVAIRRQFRSRQATELVERQFGAIDRLIVELDGEDAHSTPAQLQADARRQAHLESQGFTAIRFTWSEVELHPHQVASEVRAHLKGL